MNKKSLNSIIIFSKVNTITISLTNKTTTNGDTRTIKAIMGTSKTIITMDKINIITTNLMAKIMIMATMILIIIMITLLHMTITIIMKIIIHTIQLTHK